MKALTCTNELLELADLPDPTPGPGQLVLDVTRCGICGSDLHARRHCDEISGVMEAVGYASFMRSEQRVVFGHEFVGVVAERGKGTRGKLAVGTPVVSLPLVRRDGGIDGIGLSARAPGAYAEQVVVQESMTLAVPNGLSPDIAVLTEPMAVGWHAVNRGDVGKKDVAVVIGCGPVGLAVICILKARGVRTVVASDLSAGRRALAKTCGADLVVDPTLQSPYATAEEHGHLTTLPAAFGAAMDAIEGINRLRMPWWHVWRALDKVGMTTPRAPVVFECVGVPGMIDDVLTGAPLYSRVVVVGVCMGDDRLRPSMAINKEIDLRFVLGYTPLEFRDTLHALAEGTIDPSPLLTGVVGLPGVEAAFAALDDPETHAKIVIDPARSTPDVVPLAHGGHHR